MPFAKLATGEERARSSQAARPSAWCLRIRSWKSSTIPRAVTSSGAARSAIATMIDSFSGQLAPCTAEQSCKGSRCRTACRGNRVTFVAATSCCPYPPRHAAIPESRQHVDGARVQHHVFFDSPLPIPFAGDRARAQDYSPGDGTESVCPPRTTSRTMFCAIVPFDARFP